MNQLAKWRNSRVQSAQLMTSWLDHGIRENIPLVVHMTSIWTGMIMAWCVWLGVFVHFWLFVCRGATSDRSETLRSRLSVWRMLFWTTSWHYRCVSWWPSRGTGWSSLRGERSTLNSWGSFTIRYNQLTKMTPIHAVVTGVSKNSITAN